MRWSNRPLEARFIAGSWIVATLAMGLSVLMPDAEVTNTTVVVGLLIISSFLGPARYLMTIHLKTWAQLLDVFVALSVIALMTYFTGGSGSPAWPIIGLVLVYVGWFLELRWVLPVTIVALAAMLLPLAYEGGANTPLIEVVGLIGGVAVSIALILIMYYNHFYLLRARMVTRELASIDPRTGIYNRREFERRLQHEIDLLSYGDTDALAIVMLDLGDFKSVSANFGRAAGDRVLTETARALEKASRAEDCVARLGGDEFAVVLPGVTADTARKLAQRFARAVANALEASDIPGDHLATPSAGFALYGMHGRTLDELITAADVALTAAKTTGRSRERVSSFVVSL